jgi:hypothetical protein
MNCKNCKHWAAWGYDEDSKTHLGTCMVASSELEICVPHNEPTDSRRFILFTADFGCKYFAPTRPFEAKF